MRIEFTDAECLALLHFVNNAIIDDGMGEPASDFGENLPDDFVAPFRSACDKIEKAANKPTVIIDQDPAS